jgi:uncharacterized protein YejL (UPF0352 family)
MLGLIGISRGQLEECEAVLNEFADLLRKHQPGVSKSPTSCFKLVVLAMKKGKRGDLLRQIERHKGALSLALTVLLVYIYLCSILPTC